MGFGFWVIGIGREIGELIGKIQNPRLQIRMEKRTLNLEPRAQNLLQIVLRDLRG